MNMCLWKEKMEGSRSRLMEEKSKKRSLDWEFDIKSMAEDINLVLKTMVWILGNHRNTTILQFKLLLKSLQIQKLFMTLVLRVLNKEYASEQETLNKIWDLKAEHMKLITDARADLNKMWNDKRKPKRKRRRKMEKLVEDDENNNIIDHDGNQLVLCVEKLQELQEELEKINKEASRELLKVVQKYNPIRQPFYEKRADIIKDIPGFWSRAFLKHHLLGGLVCTEEDLKIFEFLRSIEVEVSQDVKSGYTIIFNFDSNEYFENTKLWKKYGRTKTTASPIQWAQGKIVDEQSFFKWFSEVDNIDEIGEIIKDDLWSDPLFSFRYEADEENVDNVAVKKYEDMVVKDSEDVEEND